MMRLRRLDLALFGCFSNLNIDFGERKQGRSDFHVVYGENESGKTTFMEGYLRLLYGFPLREPYGFKHARANLRVGGHLEVNGTGHDLTRVPTRANSLLNADSAPVPETLLQSVLGGLVAEDYRKLLCLDDTTIEEGGEEIANSQGDIGRLLFSAAAGISDLTAVLDHVESRAADFYKKGGSKSTHAQLKRELDTISQDIRQHDVTVSAYRVLRSDFESAQKHEAETKSGRQQLIQRKARLETLVAAHPIAEELRAKERDLANIGHYPETLDIDPEDLVAMMTTRVALISDHDRTARTIKEKAQAKDALRPRPDLIDLVQEFEVLETLKGRAESAEIDLPRRESQRKDDLQEMRLKLLELGLDGGNDPVRFVLGETQLLDLDRKLGRFREAEKSLDTAKTEERSVAERQKKANFELKAAEARLTDSPDFQPILDRHNAATLVERYVRGEHAVALARRTAKDRIADLTRKGCSFAELPRLDVTVSEAESLEHDVLKALQACEMAEENCQNAEEKAVRAQAKLEALTAASAVVTDEDAKASRAERDRLWQLHRNAFEEKTADAFEAAMRADDAKVVLRQRQEKDLADLRQMYAAVAEATTDRDAARARHSRSVTERDRYMARLSGILSCIGLPGDLSASGLADWVRAAEVARRLQSELDSEVEANAELARSAGMLREELAAVLGESSASLEALFRMAQGRMEVKAESQRKATAAKEDLDRETIALEMRRDTVRECVVALADAESQWRVAIKDALREVTGNLDMRDALPVLRKVREIDQRVTGTQRQIGGMQRDLAAFRDRMTEQCRSLPEMTGLSPLEAYRALKTAIDEARETASDLKRLEADIEEAKRAQSDAETQLSVHEKQVRILAQAFDDRIETGSLEELRVAVQTTQTALEARASIKTLTGDLLSRLNAQTRQEAEQALEGVPLEVADAELQELELDLKRVEDVLETSIAERSRAKAALDAVVGDADIAERVARRRTAEAEMQAGLLGYLEDRFGHMLANRAIRRYRDEHRSGMMEAAETAFKELTNGAYSTLTTQPDSSAEVLVAIQGADGAAKQVDAMSKGTRFQLYLALRAAAYDQMAANGTVLPFFCDDVFETFDENRTKAACSLMRRIGQQGQAIYLTHHRHVVDIAEELCGNDVRVHKI